MAPRRAGSTSESEDDAPEAFSFNSSKRAAKGADHALQRFQEEEKRKRKEANRERDRRLKERAKGKEAATTKREGKQLVRESGEEGENEGEAEDGPRDELEERMQRAMREAELESDEEDAEEEEEEWGGIGDGAGEDDASHGSDSQGGSDSEDEIDDDEDENAASDDTGDADETPSEAGSPEPDSEEPAPRKKAPSAPTYLPDHLFKVAFSQSVSSSKRRLDVEDEPADSSSRPRKKQRKRAKRPGKDITVGSRTIRTLAPTSPAVPTTVPRAMMPPARVNKFLNRSLNLKGKPQPAKFKGWERRAANVGVMKRSGPAAHFVRNSLSEFS
ncbi:hypothetical protein DAEQUDRAFT_810093 [Daedalea quercina L-15889]|uniref:Uncharacterized protein n=1 Tax=Daedalea quercina L-15889 TaxID=1314783 RepID=A0A165RS21_9APHY|nr:hypothetical protein DAEQUDRAFT_810093 [Daedalea quercina L-15889]